jgi:hypothetical protein
MKIPAINFLKHILIYILYIFIYIWRDDSHDICKDEVQLWRKRIAGQDIKNSLETLDFYNKDTFPNVYQTKCFAF